MLGQVTIEDHGTKERERHSHLGRTVTSLTAACPASRIQTVSTWATPAGLFRSPGTVYFRPNSVSSTSETSPPRAIRRTSATNASAFVWSKPKAEKTQALESANRMGWGKQLPAHLPLVNLDVPRAWQPHRWWLSSRCVEHPD